jgi:Uma2 family endonuclease
MSAVSIAGAWPSPGKPFTVAELDRMPDDGHRYELPDGALAVSPRPGNPHQEVAAELLDLLRSACPPGLRALPEPAARVSGGEPFQAMRPFAAEVVPARLVAGLQPPA